MTDQTPNTEPKDKLDKGFYASLFAAVASYGAYGYSKSQAVLPVDAAMDALEKGAEAVLPALIALAFYKISRGDLTISFKNPAVSKADSPASSENGPDIGQP